MQPQPSGSSVRPSNGGSAALHGEHSQRLKRKACGDESRKKFRKISADFPLSPQTAYHCLDVSEVSTAVTAVNGLASDPTPVAFKRGSVKNEKIYLDLKDGQLTQDLEKYITRFGGIVEKFLSKDITCVVTSRINPNDMKAEDAILKTEAVSPRTAEKPKPDIYSSLGAMSRGKTLLLRSNSTKASSSVCGPVQFARTWKIPVVEVSVLRNMLRKENNHRKQVLSQSSKPSVKKLDKPFVKVEDAMQMYSTNFRLFNSFPMSYLSPVDSLPCNGASQSNESSMKKKAKQKRIKKSGYCECCDISFTDQKEHLNSRMHKAFVMRNENFASLDALVSKLPSLEKFALAVELDTKNLSSSGSITGVDPGSVHGLSDSQTQDLNLNPFVRDRSVHGTKRLYPGSSADSKLDVKNLCDAQNLKSSGSVLPGTIFAPNSSCPIRKPRTKKSLNTSSKSCTHNSDSFHIYEKCDDDRNLIRANDKHAGKLVNKIQMPSKGSNSDLTVDLNCPVDLSLPKSSAGVSSYQSPVSSSSTVSELNFANAAVCSRKISEVSKSLKIGKSLKINKDANQVKLATSNCSDKISDISDPKMARDQLISERMDITLDMKLLTTPIAAANAELRSPFLGCANAISKEVSKDDDLDFSSDEVSDSADEKVDWRINLRNSCNKVLNILEDSNSSKDFANIMPDDCANNSLVKLELTNVQVAEDCHEVSSNKTEYHFSNLKNVNMPGSEILPVLDKTEKTAARKVSLRETSTSSKTKHGGVGIVRPWEMVSNKPDPNQLRIDKESHCNVGSQMLGVSDSSGCVLQTESEQCSNSNTVYGQIKSSENCSIAVTNTEEVRHPEATHSDDDPPTTHSIEGSNPKVTHLNEDIDPETKCSTDNSNPEKTPASAKGTTIISDLCTVDRAVLGTAMSCHVPQRVLHSPVPVNVCIAEQGAKAVTAETVPATIAESPSRFQDSPHSSSQSSMIVDVEACDERSDDSEDKYQTPIPTYEVITPVKPQMSSSLEIDDRCITFPSNYQVFDQQAVDQPPSWPVTPVLVNGQVVYLPANVVGNPMSPTVSKQLTGMGLTNGNAACEFLPGANCELQMQKQDSACSSLDSGFCASINTVTVDSYPGSPVERSVVEAETSVRKMKRIRSHTEDPVSSPVPIPSECSDSLPAAKQAEHEDPCTSAIPVSSLIPSQCKTLDSVPLDDQSNSPTSTALPVAPKTPHPIPVPLQTESSDKTNLHIEGEGVGSLATPLQTQSFSSISIQAADDESPSPVLCQTDNNNLFLASGQSRNPDCSQPVIQPENSDSLPVHIQTENVDLCANQEEKSYFFAAISSTENHRNSSGVDKNQIDEMECKDVLVQPALPQTKVKKVDTVEDLAGSTVHMQEFLKVDTVPEVQIYPDLMSGINELPEKAKTQMPDLLMEAKNDTALDSPSSSVCPLMSTGVHHQTLPESLPPRSNYSGSEPMDVGFGELSEDFFTTRSNPITFYGIDKNEEIPWMDNAWGPANHAVETPAAAVDTWPEELATIVQSSCPNELSPSCYVGLDSLMMSAPIGTPNCVSFSDDESCVPTTAKKENSSGVLCGPRTDIRSTNSVNSVAEPSVLDDVVLTALSKILEDASKEWQAERQKSNTTDDDEAAVHSTLLSVCVADKEMKQETCNRISVSHLASVEISTSPMLETPKPIVQMELQSVAIDEAKHVDFSEVLCSVPQSNLIENSSACVDKVQQDDRSVPQTLEHCMNETKKESDETSETQPFSTVCTPVGELDDLDKLMQMLKALNEETKFCNDDAELTSSCNSAATNSCQTLTKVNSSELVLDLPNNFCDSFAGISYTKAHRTSRQVASMAKSVHLYSDSNNISANNFSKDAKERACQFDEKNRKDRCKWKMTYISGLKFLFQRLLHSPDQSHCFGKYSIKSLGSERLSLCISKNKSKFNVKS